MQEEYDTILPVMKKLYKLFSTILVITILVGVGWYFFPTDQVRAGAQNLKQYVSRVKDNFNSDNVISQGFKADDDEGYGDKGEGLSFDSTSCPYRRLLSVKQQGVYNQIYANARDCADTFRLVCELTADELNETYVAVICDHPEIFWLDNRYQYGYANDDKDTAVQITLEYNDLASNLGASKARFAAAAKKIIDGASKYADAADKEKYVFQTLCANVDYKDNASCNQSAYSALVNRSTVCAGYSRAMQYVLNELGIPCYYIFGKADGGYHAWNIVQLGGEWYGVDLTWSDQTSGLTYTYFNVTDAALAANHTRSDMSKKLPVASGTKYAYSPAKEKGAASGGSSAAKVVSSMDAYNSACYAAITAKGVGSYSFSMTLSGKELYDQILSSADRRDFEAGFLDDAAAALGLKKFGYEYTIDGDLDDNTGLVNLTQHITLTKG